MTEYIERKRAIEDACNALELYQSEYAELEDALNRIPAADVAPVVHGQWITEFDDLGWLKHTCTVCGYVKRTDVHVSLGWNYCPNCGQKADGGDNNG